MDITQKQIAENYLKSIFKNLEFEMAVHKNNIDWEHIKQLAEEAIKTKEVITKY